ncbi:TlpA family protein disulfide reductase [Jeotgalibacillus proteolyticus]|uniref:TlpA family protein disulfide reductase n=1 Tax=Jeotgalibacillus proteolyticus TaxID=2082395 RepID=UPI003CE71A60
MRRWIQSGTWAFIMGGFGFYLLLTSGGMMNEPGFERYVAVTNEPVETTVSPAAAPDFSLQDLQGETIKLSDLRGKTVVVNFWTTWCPPCHEEIPELEAFYAEYVKENPDVVLLGVNLSKEDHGEESVKHFVKANLMSFPILLDLDGETQRNYQILTIPTTFIVNKDGGIMKKLMGPVTKEELIELVEP